MYGDSMIDFTDVIKCELIDSCVSDLSVVNAARISYDTEHAVMENPQDSGLIGYLMKNKHGSVFEHGYFKFRVELPIFAIREHHRHRVGHGFNEMSGRYTKLEPKFYLPKTARIQEGKPGHYIYVEKQSGDEWTMQMRGKVIDSYVQSWNTYEELLEDGIAKEQARIVLPVGIYTKMIWSCNPRSLMHFMGLRLAPTAQKEIRVVAEAAAGAMKELMPITWGHFKAGGFVAP